eukprot:CAMPEP_0183346792 /NCGR_PEP_ID=MMETSP0164_2-20130417/11810_1 /TAXON_ID=221442 /ORGANISM="Coccolithus pelagicus ssp braarudi, Strain PLY182g" /LENGTH=40 /DNA_ID= /DNA_START= /DNA_END= /DNA_ORIENTATION=
MRSDVSVDGAAATVAEGINVVAPSDDRGHYCPVTAIRANE